MTDLMEIEGIGQFHAGSLESIGITSQAQLLEAAATPAGRQALATKCDLSMEQVLNWANRADLARVSGVTDEFADVLEAAGVDTVPELAQRNAINLSAKLIEVCEEEILIVTPPTLDDVTGWVEEAKSLPRVLRY